MSRRSTSRPQTQQGFLIRKCCGNYHGNSCSNHSRALSHRLGRQLVDPPPEAPFRIPVADDEISNAGFMQEECSLPGYRCAGCRTYCCTEVSQRPGT